jgi:hypothetical protein
MLNRPCIAAALFLTAAILLAPAHAAVIVITQAKANAGGVTPGDAPGFPVRLSQPGAYRLDTNLTVPANRNGIVVASHYVDIDMNGFRLLGANASGTKVALNGVVSGFGDGHIHGGFISSFKDNGILLLAAPNSNAWSIENMQIVGNDDDGINAGQSHYLRISNNLILVNGRRGIDCREYCHVEGNNVSDNGDVGVQIRSGTVLGNSIFSNGSLGIYDPGSTEDTGIGNNTVANNLPGTYRQTAGTVALQPNACVPNQCE